VSADAIDPDRLPHAALVDSSVLIPALDRKRSDDEAEICRAFWDAMVAAKRRIVIAAPSISELLRGRPPTYVPRVPSVEIVPFDELAAITLGTVMPTHLLKRVRDKVHGPLAYYKHDALIVACGIRRKIDCIVTTDAPMAGLGRELKIMVAAPISFAQKQVVFRYQPVSPSGGSGEVQPTAPSATKRPSSAPPPA
jgi:predicted nucleic acid-binding protein